MSAHYSKYFKKVTGVAGEEYYEFDWAATKMAYKSFLDSIVLELCFPMDTYPKMILFRILKEAIEEEPKEAKRFPQKLFDTVGDLAVWTTYYRTLLLTYQLSKGSRGAAN